MFDLSVRIIKIFHKSVFHVSAMSLEESRRSQRPYRYGMVLLCVGALINWLGLAENYVEPVRYVGVACIVAGALLICAAMCCWLHAPPTRTSTHTQHTNHPITAQVIWQPGIYLLYRNKTLVYFETNLEKKLLQRRKLKLWFIHKHIFTFTGLPIIIHISFFEICLNHCHYTKLCIRVFP